MKVVNLTANSQIYTANVYLLTGTWNCLGDVNTLIDVGRDETVIDMIYQASTGIGKTRVEQVILTHNHYDHANQLANIKRHFKPIAYGYSSYLDGVDRYVKGGEMIKIADTWAELIYTPGHSNDSICIYCQEEKVLFAGDTPLIIRSSGSSYEWGFLQALEYLSQKDIKTIYFGHGSPLTSGCNQDIQETLSNVCRSQIIGKNKEVLRNELV